MEVTMTMEDALAADGEKLRQLTGEDHGPFSLEELLVPPSLHAQLDPERDLEAEDSAFFSDDESDGWAYNQGFYDGIQAAMGGSSNWARDVRDFHKACGTVDPTEPTWPSYEKRSLRYHLQFEEGNELSAELLPEHCLFVGQFLPHAVESPEHLAALAKEIVDVIYVAVGTALSCGININAVWEAVHASNMAKVDPTIGTVRRRDDGKILKPEGWQTPDIKKVLFPE